METMQPLMMAQLHNDEQFLYEVKYDGFRAILYWTKSEIKLISRNKKELTEQFPEIIQVCRQYTKIIQAFLPITLDGELMVLNNPYQGNFSLLQQRGRLKQKEKIEARATARPAHFYAFDVLGCHRQDMRKKPLTERKETLEMITKLLEDTLIHFAPTFSSLDMVKKYVTNYKAEGTVAKHKDSTYIVSKHHHDWFKEKNWRTIYGCLTAYNHDNGYFEISVFQDDVLVSIGQCKHGLTKDEKASLQSLFLKEGVKNNSIYTIPPAICAAIHTLDLVDGQLREPEFVKIFPNMDPQTCTSEQLIIDLAMLPEEVSISNSDKIFWAKVGIMKKDLLLYMREIYSLMKPYIDRKELTLIRCPDGVDETCFFQKHLPTYAPGFFPDSPYIICEKLTDLIWLANHSAVEYHIPFQQIDTDFPDEIVFDLDPPSRTAFPMAIEVANMFKEVFDELQLQTFIKTSGNKGLQIHLPLPFDTFSYEKTGHFTENIARIVQQAAPDICTTERMKEKRQARLYIDYVQHGRKKTIIAPYSPRKVDEATVATPLKWEEVREGLSPLSFTIENVVDRIQTEGCPWLFHYEKARYQSWKKALPLFQTS